MVELLSPVGDFECLKAAVQNGANAVYFGSNLFSARAFATNFDKQELEQAINYAKLRGVKTHLTLNTLIKNEEFATAFNVAKTAYELGIDAIIVQDLGLATTLINTFPDLEVHASTQMTTTNLQEVKALEKLGFKRAVLSRECSLSEIRHICENSNIAIEVFIHGALCISYSGQCLFSSMVGGRSGNRGKCAQPCRLPYSLISQKEPQVKNSDSSLQNTFTKNITSNVTKQANLNAYAQNKNMENFEIIDKGHLLSPRDLCSLENLPLLISVGVDSFKIEGRMKSPTYVATVTRIYRKYIDLATKFLNQEIKDYIIDENDKKDLMQVFNRGGFSAGHLHDEPNKNLIYPQKPNNMGIYLGKIIKYNKNKGHVTARLENDVSVGDGISFENENTKYTISELMNSKNNFSDVSKHSKNSTKSKLNSNTYIKNENIKSAILGSTVTFGRMKGNIKVGDKIYKITDKTLTTNALNSYTNEFVKTKLSCYLSFKVDKKVCVNIKNIDFNIDENFEYDYIPELAKNAPITEEKIREQFNKTLNTCFEFFDIKIDMDNNLFIPTSILNDIRREAISKIENKIINNFKRMSASSFSFNKRIEQTKIEEPTSIEKNILLNILNPSFDYTRLKKVNRIYIPLKYFADAKFKEIINILSKKSKIYIYMPVIIKDRYFESIEKTVLKAVNSFNVSGAVVAETSSLCIFSKIYKSKDTTSAKNAKSYYRICNNIIDTIDLEKSNFEIIANYNFNVFNSYTLNELTNFGFSKITLSPELSESELNEVILKDIRPNAEIICYGKIPLMTMSYCLLGNSNRCYKNCKHLCQSNDRFYLNDRYGFNFRAVPDNLQTLTTIYNSRNINISNVNATSLRFDFLEESIEEINAIVY